MATNKPISIRKGNDTLVMLTLTTQEGEVMNLQEVQDLSVSVVHNACGRAIKAPYRITSEGALQLEINAPEQELGVYDVRVSFNKPNADFADGLQAVSWERTAAFKVVPTDTELSDEAHTLQGVLAAIAKGERGERGEQGIQGEQGERGLQGEKGDPFTFADLTDEQKRELGAGASAEDLLQAVQPILDLMSENVRDSSSQEGVLHLIVTSLLRPKVDDDRVDASELITRATEVTIAQFWLAVGKDDEERNSIEQEVRKVVAFIHDKLTLFYPTIIQAKTFANEAVGNSDRLISLENDVARWWYKDIFDLILKDFKSLFNDEGNFADFMVAEELETFIPRLVLYMATTPEERGGKSLTDYVYDKYFEGRAGADRATVDEMLRAVANCFVRFQDLTAWQEKLLKQLPQAGGGAAPDVDELLEAVTPFYDLMDEETKENFYVSTKEDLARYVLEMKLTDVYEFAKNHGWDWNSAFNDAANSLCYNFRMMGDEYNQPSMQAIRKGWQARLRVKDVMPLYDSLVSRIQSLEKRTEIIYELKRQNEAMKKTIEDLESRLQALEDKERERDRYVTEEN